MKRSKKSKVLHLLVDIFVSSFETANLSQFILTARTAISNKNTNINLR